MAAAQFAIIFPIALLDPDLIGEIASQILDTTTSAIYYIALNTIFAATLGKMVFKAKIVVADTGKKMGLGRAIGRYFAMILSGLPLGLGFMWAGWDKEKRTFHDMICGTRVIKS